MWTFREAMTVTCLGSLLWELAKHLQPEVSQLLTVSPEWADVSDLRKQGLKAMYSMALPEAGRHGGYMAPTALPSYGPWRPTRYQVAAESQATALGWVTQESLMYKVFSGSSHPRLTLL